MAGKELNTMFENQYLRQNKFPKYLGVILDWTPSLKEHLTRTAGKIKTRNHILHQLCIGTSADTLRSCALDLVFFAVKYAAPVWLSSCHNNKIEAQLNDTMNIESGIKRFTPRQWFAILGHNRHLIAAEEVLLEESMTKLSKITPTLTFKKPNGKC